MRTTERESRWVLDLAPILGYMEQSGYLELTFGDIKVGEGDPLLPEDLAIQRFFVTLPGHIEVEFWMKDDVVKHLQVRQACMTLMEIQENGDVLPNVNVSVAHLPEGQQTLVQALARKFLHDGKGMVKQEAQKTITAMAEKVLFTPPKGSRKAIHHLRTGSAFNS